MYKVTKFKGPECLLPSTTKKEEKKGTSIPRLTRMDIPIGYRREEDQIEKRVSVEKREQEQRERERSQYSIDQQVGE